MCACKSNEFTKNQRKTNSFKARPTKIGNVAKEKKEMKAAMQGRHRRMYYYILHERVNFRKSRALPSLMDVQKDLFVLFVVVLL